MKSRGTVAVALVCAAMFAATGCTLRMTGTASTSMKAKGSAKATHKGKPTGDPAHPTVKAKPKDGGSGKVVHKGKAVGASASAEVHVALPSPTLSVGVKEAKKACPNKPEVTNGIDDDCDGEIDENEVGSGPMQITLWWESPADLDLRVQDPTGAVISYKNKNSASGGFMDKDSRSSCKGNETIENIYWADKPPKGNYKVKVKYYSYCKDKSKPTTTAHVTVSYKGQILGPYTLDMNQGDEVDILEFNLDE